MMLCVLVGRNIIHDFLHLGKGIKVIRNQLFLLLTYMCSILIYIKHYSGPMCFLPF